MKMIANKNFIRIGLIYICIFFIGIPLFAQQKTMISGTILDSTTGQPIPGVNVVEINENDRIIGGGITDFDGNFLVPVISKENRLMISFIGYKSQKVAISSLSEGQSIKLEPDVQSIDVIDVVGERARTETDGFMTITKKEKTTASVKIEMKEVEDLQAANVAEAVQGRLAGVDISSSSGDPGAGLRIQVRGNTSLFGEDSSPLIVVNGLPYETAADDDFDFSSGDAQNYSELLDIPVEEILSIEIKKDAASAATYGGEAANGVVLITTKRGVKGKPRVEYSFKAAIKNQPDQIPMLNGDEYSTMVLEGLLNANNGLAADQPIELSYDPNYKYYHEYNQNTNWIDEITQTGFSQNHDIAVSGGGEQSRYRVSSSLFDEKGTTVGTDLQRFNTKLALDYNISTKTIISADFSYTHTNQNGIYDLKDNQPQLRKKAYIKSPNMGIYLTDENGNPTDVYFSPKDNFQGNGNEWYNPVASANESYRKIESEALRASLNLMVDLGKGLNLRSYVVTTMDNKETRAWNPQSVSGQLFVDDATNKVSSNDGKSFTVQHRTDFSYSKTFSAEGIANLLGANPENNKQTLKWVASYGITTKNSVSLKGSGSNTAPGLENFYTPSRIGSGNYGNSESQLRKGFALLTGHYDLFKKYLISGTIRTDATSKVSRDSRWKPFWSAAVGWNIDQEVFLKDFDWLDFAKVRYSYGINGNLPDDIKYYGTFSSSPAYINVNGVKPDNLQLDALQYEITTQSNVGFELGVFRKLSMELELYRKVTEDKILKDFKVPSSSGFDQVKYGNFGSISNTGIEFSGSYNVMKNKDWDVKFNFNIATNKNKVEALPENYTLSEGNPLKNGEYVRNIEVGKPVGSIYGYQYLGVYSKDEDNYLKDENGNVILNPDGTVRQLRFGDANGYVFKGGDAIYKDLNKDGVINQYDIIYLGDSNPKFFGGFGFNIAYKGFFINPFFQYTVGNYVENATRMSTEKMYGKENQSISTLRRWRKPGDQTDIPRALYGKGYNWLGSDRFIEDASYLRFKTLTVGYRFSDKVTNQIGIRGARLFVTLTNLYTWTNYTGQDPEVGNLKNAKWKDIGKDDSRTPPTTNISFGLNVQL